MLSKVETTDGDLVGVEVTWAPPANGVPNTLADKLNPWTYACHVRVPAGNRSITVTPTPMSRKVAWRKVNRAIVKPGASTTVAVADGGRVSVDVLAPDGVTASSYVFTVKKSQ